jgi:hypothetical protein
MAKKKRKKNSLSKRQNEDRRAKLIEEAMKIVWSSLDSHLPYTHKKYTNANGEHRGFHKKCVKEYVRLMEILKEFY